MALGRPQAKLCATAGKRMVGTENRRSTEQRNTDTMSVSATADLPSEGENGFASHNTFRNLSGCVTPIDTADRWPLRNRGPPPGPRCITDSSNAARYHTVRAELLARTSVARVLGRDVGTFSRPFCARKDCNPAARLWAPCSGMVIRATTTAFCTAGSLELSQRNETNFIVTLPEFTEKLDANEEKSSGENMFSIRMLGSGAGLASGKARSGASAADTPVLTFDAVFMENFSDTDRVYREVYQNRPIE